MPFCIRASSLPLAGWPVSYTAIGYGCIPMHPDYTEDGIFRTKLALPSGGDFLFVTEFIPDQKEITVH
ncbi:hypothetical protein D3P07_18825 [Paenibacillus sp. 1011MAR3C5]|nr:hypothetical protein D3P07_18825 [Paenibacillus sp. 1011MAR3C5]